MFHGQAKLGNCRQYGEYTQSPLPSLAPLHSEYCEVLQNRFNDHTDVIKYYLFIYILLRRNFNFVARNIKYSHICQAFIIEIINNTCTEFVGVCMIYFYTKFHVPNSNNSLVIGNISKIKCLFYAPAILYPDILHTTLNKSCKWH